MTATTIEATAMIVAVLQENFVKGVGDAMKAIDARPALPVLSNVLIEALDTHRIRITGSNIRQTITVTIPAKVDQPGAITVPAKLLHGLVSLMNKERIDITLDSLTHTITLRCGSTVSKIKGIEAAQYPPVKSSINARRITLEGKVFKRMVIETAFACAKEDARPVLTGVYVNVSEVKHNVTFAAADGYRLAVRTQDLGDEAMEKIEFLIPRNTLVAAASLVKTDEDVTIVYPSEGKTGVITIQQDLLEISCQALEGRFPDFAAIIPRNHKTRITANREEWKKRCGIAEIFSRDDAYSVRLAAQIPLGSKDEKGILMMSGKSAERGNADNSLEVHMEGDQIETWFDVRLLSEVLDCLDDESVDFHSAGADSPGVIRPLGREDYTYVIMPMSR